MRVSAPNMPSNAEDDCGAVGDNPENVDTAGSAEEGPGPYAEVMGAAANVEFSAVAPEDVMVPGEGVDQDGDPRIWMDTSGAQPAEAQQDSMSWTNSYDKLQQFWEAGIDGRDSQIVAIESIDWDFELKYGQIRRIKEKRVLQLVADLTKDEPTSHVRVLLLRQARMLCVNRLIDFV